MSQNFCTSAFPKEKLKFKFRPPAEDYELKETITSPPRADDKVVLHDKDCHDRLGFSFLTRKKWTILFAVFFV